MARSFLIQSRTAQKTGIIEVPIFECPYLVNHGGVNPPYFEPRSIWPMVQRSDNSSYNFDLGSVRVTNVYPYFKTENFINNPGSGISSSLAPVYLGGQMTGEIGGAPAFWFVYPNIRLLDQQIPFAKADIPVTSNIQLLGRPFCMDYNGGQYFAVLQYNNGGRIDRYLYNAAGVQLTELGYISVNNGEGVSFVNTSMNEPRYDKNYIFSTPTANFNFYGILVPEENTWYNITLSNSADDAKFQSGMTYYTYIGGQVLVKSTPGPSGQSNTVYIISYDGKRYAELAFVPETSTVSSYLADGYWTVAIDPAGVVYVITNHSVTATTKIFSSLGFNLIFNPTVYPLSGLVPLALSCYDTCVAP